jgi:hypothetical protein
MPITNTSHNSGGNLVVTVPKESTFKLPEGKYSAKIRSVRKLDKQNARGSSAFVRFLFLVNVPGLERFDCLAKADFPLNLENGTDLRNIINRLLGRTYLTSLSGQQFGLDALVGTECEIEVEHVNLDGRESFDFPLVVVRDIQARGTMCLTRPIVAD